MILACAALSAGLNAFLIPKVGIIGAAISNIVSYFVLAAIVTVWARRTINYSIDFKYLAKVIVAALAMALCIYFVKVDSILRIILIIISGVAVYGIVLLLLKAFSEQDKRLIKQTLVGIIPKSRK
jgi:O-antigen/teichoic acid export membrane protein